MSTTPTSTSRPRCRSTSWTRIPPHLHRLSIPLLIGLTVLQLHRDRAPETEVAVDVADVDSKMLAAVFFCMATLGVVLDGALRMLNRSGNTDGDCAPTTTSSSPSKLRLAISLTRATLYAFIGDAAVAQLLLLPSSPSSTITTVTGQPELVLSTANWIQLGLAGGMWLLGALLWVMEPLSYWLAVSRSQSHGCRRASSSSSSSGNIYREEWEKAVRVENAYFLLNQDDSDVEIEVEVA